MLERLPDCAAANLLVAAHWRAIGRDPSALIARVRAVDPDGRIAAALFDDRAAPPLFEPEPSSTQWLRAAPASDSGVLVDAQLREDLTEGQALDLVATDSEPEGRSPLAAQPAGGAGPTPRQAVPPVEVSRAAAGELPHPASSGTDEGILAQPQPATAPAADLAQTAGTVAGAREGERDRVDSGAEASGGATTPRPGDAVRAVAERGGAAWIGGPVAAAAGRAQVEAEAHGAGQEVASPTLAPRGASGQVPPRDQLAPSPRPAAEAPASAALEPEAPGEVAAAPAAPAAGRGAEARESGDAAMREGRYFDALAAYGAALRASRRPQR
jgi:hypothetical protein